MFSASITEVHAFFKWQNSIKTHTSCKKILQEKFRERICGAFKAQCFALCSKSSSVLQQWLLRGAQEGVGMHFGMAR